MKPFKWKGRIAEFSIHLLQKNLTIPIWNMRNKASYFWNPTERVGAGVTDRSQKMAQLTAPPLPTELAVTPESASQYQAIAVKD